MNKTFDARVQLKRDTKEEWERNDPVLLNGEVIIVDFEDGSHKNKTGDGVSHYSALPFDGTIEYSKHIGAIVSASGWSGNSQRVAVPGLLKDNNGMVSFPQEISPEQYVAAVNAQLRITGQEAGFVTVTADGTVPKVDIPLSVILLASADSSSATQVVLSGSGWSGKEQTVAVSGMSASTNGIASVSDQASETQLVAARNAKLRTSSQGSGTLTFIADGAVPSVDIPISVILLGQEV